MSDLTILSSNGYVAIGAGAVLILLLGAVLGPRVHENEPPLLKPTIPFVGHLIGLIWHQANYHVILRRKTRRPLATLPMLNGKMYAIWDPALVASGLRNKKLSTSPQIIAVSKGLFRLKDETDTLIREEDSPLIEQMMSHIIPNALNGQNLRRMNEVALAQIAADFNNTTSEDVPDLWAWIRRSLTDPTTKALYGKEDPFAKDPKLIESLWNFESNLAKLLPNIFPSIITPVGNDARARLTKGLEEYYSKQHYTDESASEFVRSRARHMRKHHVPTEDIPKLEVMLPFAAMVNTVPTLFWFFSFVMSKPALVARIRLELEQLITREGDNVTLPLGALDQGAPVLMSCYRETLRIVDHQVASRTVMEDTTISDGKGNSYLLCKGTMVQMSIGATHSIEEIWGSDVHEFRPERLEDFSNRKGGEGGKAMRTAFMPFGGGQHYCPGRNFALLEMMAVMSTVILGFHVEPLSGQWKLPVWATRSLVDAITKPTRNGTGMGIRLSRREGWEKVNWSYEL